MKFIFANAKPFKPKLTLGDFKSGDVIIIHEYPYLIINVDNVLKIVSCDGYIQTNPLEYHLLCMPDSCKKGINPVLHVDLK